MNLLESIGTIVVWCLCAAGALTVGGWAWDGAKLAQTRHDKIKELEKIERSVGP